MFLTSTTLLSFYIDVFLAVSIRIVPTCIVFFLWDEKWKITRWISTLFAACRVKRMYFSLYIHHARMEANRKTVYLLKYFVKSITNCSINDIQYVKWKPNPAIIGISWCIFSASVFNCHKEIFVDIVCAQTRGTDANAPLRPENTRHGSIFIIHLWLNHSAFPILIPINTVILDAAPFVGPLHIRLIDWISHYLQPNKNHTDPRGLFQ